MPKNIFIQIASFISAGIVVVSIALNKALTNNYLPQPIKIDLSLFIRTVGFSLFLILTIYFVTKYDKLLIPGILRKLDQIKYLLFELTNKEVVYISFLAGISEELLFRGCLQPVFGLIITSLLFGAAHFFTFGYFIIGTGIGFYLGGIYTYSGNILGLYSSIPCTMCLHLNY
jgi:membrane protease YdiL (CAAX protease family)